MKLTVAFVRKRAANAPSRIRSLRPSLPDDLHDVCAGRAGQFTHSRRTAAAWETGIRRFLLQHMPREAAPPTTSTANATAGRSAGARRAIVVFFGWSVLGNTHAGTANNRFAIREQWLPCGHRVGNAHAAAWHWQQVGTELQRMRALMLLAQAHAQSGLGSTALAYAEEARTYFLGATSTPDWEVAFTHVVHAHAAWAARAGAQHAHSYAQAVQAVAAIADQEDRNIVQLVFRHVPAP